MTKFKKYAIILFIGNFCINANANSKFLVNDCVKPNGMDYWEKGFHLIKEVGQRSYLTEHFGASGFSVTIFVTDLLMFSKSSKYEKFLCPAWIPKKEYK